MCKEEGVAGATVSVDGYQVKSPSNVRMEEDFLVKGDDLSVLDASGNVIFENLRAFMPVDAKNYLIRKQDGLWYLSTPKKQKRLKEVNLKAKNKVMMFDERGKLHFNQVSPHYKNIG